MEYQVVMIGSDVDPPRPDSELTLAAELVMADYKESRRTYDIASEQSVSLTTPELVESPLHSGRNDWPSKLCQQRSRPASKFPTDITLSFSSHHSMGDMDTVVDSSEGTLKAAGSSAEAETGLNVASSLISEDTQSMPGHPAGGDQISSACSASSSAEFLMLERFCENNNTADIADFPQLERTSVDLRYTRADGLAQFQLDHKECTCHTLGECQCPEEECTCPDYFRTEDTLGAAAECKCPDGDFGLCACPDGANCDDPTCQCTCSPCDYTYPPCEYACPGCSEMRDHDVDGLCECPDPNCVGPDGNLGADASEVKNVSTTSSRVSSPSRPRPASSVQSSPRPAQISSDDLLPPMHAQDILPPRCKPASSPQFSRSGGKKDPPHPLATNLPRLMKDINLPRLLEEPEITAEALENKRERGDTASVTDLARGDRLPQSAPVRKSVSDPNSFHSPRRKQDEHLFDCGPLNTNEADRMCMTTFPVLKTSPSKRRSSKIPKLVGKGAAELVLGVKGVESSESYVVSPRRMSPKVEESKKNSTRVPSTVQEKSSSVAVGMLEKPPVIPRKPALARPVNGYSQNPKQPPPVPPKPSPAQRFGLKQSPPSSHTSRRQPAAKSPDPTYTQDAKRHARVTSPSPTRAQETWRREARRKSTEPSPDSTPIHDTRQGEAWRHLGLASSDLSETHDSDDSLASPVIDTNVKLPRADGGGRGTLATETTTVESGKMLFAKTGLLAEIMVRKTHSARDFPKTQASVRGSQAGMSPTSPPQHVRASPPRASPRSSPSNSSTRSSPARPGGTYTKGGPTVPTSPLLRKAQSTLSPSARGGHLPLEKVRCAQPPSSDKMPSPPSLPRRFAKSMGKTPDNPQHDGEQTAAKMASLRPDRNFLYPHPKMQADVNENSNSATQPDESPQESPQVKCQFQNDPQMFSGGLKLPKVIRIDSTPQIQDFERKDFRKTISKLSGGSSSLPLMTSDVLPTSQASAGNPRITLTNQPAVLPARVNKLRCERRANPYPTKLHKPCVTSVDSDQEIGGLSAAFPLPVPLSGHFVLRRPDKEKED